METIWKQAEALKPELIARRRDLHAHPETGWTEFRTASLIISELKALGYEVHFGAEVVAEASMMGRPSTKELEGYMKRAITEGADPVLVEKMAGGKTGVVGILDTGSPGKTVAFRFDMDCNDVEEDKGAGHRPAAEGFCSTHTKAMHACGHDGHVTIGLAVAKLLKENMDKLHGRIKLIFQPAEEGVRGALAMVDAGVVDDVDYVRRAHRLQMYSGGHTGHYDGRLPGHHKTGCGVPRRFRPCGSGAGRREERLAGGGPGSNQFKYDLPAQPGFQPYQRRRAECGNRAERSA